MPVGCSRQSLHCLSSLKCFKCPSDGLPSPVGMLLSEISEDLRRYIIMKLDVEWRPGIKGWYRVGEEFGVGELTLNVLTLECERPAGSPTNELLNILDAWWRTPLRDFIDVLCRPEVAQHDLAWNICNWKGDALF